MSTALKPIQDVRPSANPRLWSCYYGPQEGIKQELPVKEIAGFLNVKGSAARDGWFKHLGPPEWLEILGEDGSCR